MDTAQITTVDDNTYITVFYDGGETVRYTINHDDPTAYVTGYGLGGAIDNEYLPGDACRGREYDSVADAIDDICDGKATQIRFAS
jgi:hypothetical protein